MHGSGDERSGVEDEPFLEPVFEFDPGQARGRFGNGEGGEVEGLADCEHQVGEFEPGFVEGFFAVLFMCLE